MIPVLGTDADTIDGLTQGNIYRGVLHLGFCFTGGTVAGFFGAAGGMTGIFGIEGGVGGWGGTGARPGPPLRPLKPPPGVL